MLSHPYERPLETPDARPIRRLLVFCGSRVGHDPAHRAIAGQVGRLLGRKGVTLVYGGGALGLMGEVARAALAEGGRVEGVIPRFLMELEVAATGLSELVVVESLHVRKAEMFARADAVLALPGGIGTLDELVEILSWRNLRLHSRPIMLLGEGDFWEPFLQLVGHLARTGFAHERMVETLSLLPSVAALEAHLGPA
ncbi:LOG family protein [Thermaurantiacus sp.]